MLIIVNSNDMTNREIHVSIVKLMIGRIYLSKMIGRNVRNI